VEQRLGTGLFAHSAQIARLRDGLADLKERVENVAKSAAARPSWMPDWDSINAEHAKMYEKARSPQVTEERPVVECVRRVKAVAIGSEGKHVWFDSGPNDSIRFPTVLLPASSDVKIGDRFEISVRRVL
jgi:hypothetical protein